MGWLDRLLGRKVTPAAPIRNLRELVSRHIVPAVRLSAGTSPTRSHFGGDPRLPPGVSWPERGSKRLPLLVRISLPELHRASPVEWLPRDGALLFFYDVDEQPWGFEPK